MDAVALISDLHANLVALDAVLGDIRELGIERIVCLGDIVDLGPEPQATVNRLRELGVPCVRGNHDTLDEGPPVPMLARIEAWTREQLDAGARAWLEELPFELTLDLDGARLWCVHGSPRDCRESLLASTSSEDIGAWVGTRAFEVLACGHTHVPLTRAERGRWFVNVGSVGMPFEAPFAGHAPRVLRFCDYAIIRSQRAAHGVALSLEHRRISLDFDAFAQTVRAASFPDAERWLAHWDVH